MTEFDGDKSAAKLSEKVLKNLDDIKSKIKSEYKTNTSVDSEETKELIKRKPGRKKNETSDAIENISVNTGRVGLLKFKTDIGADNVLDVINEANAAEKEHIKKKYNRSKLAKYVFKDAFGNKCGVFYGAKSRAYLSRILDIQINCISDISKANSTVWKVYGFVDSEEYYYKKDIIDVGYVFCCGISNALILGRELCEMKNCSISHIEYFNIGDESNGRER